MKYSIITPVYNSEKCLKDCIESVIAQSYTDWEMILIDDGSTDGSPSICDEYAKKDSRIIAVHIENGGAYKARIAAKDYITGEYTVGLDSDDMYSSNCLELVEKAREKTNADMIIFGRKFYDETVNRYTTDVLGYEFGRVYEKEELIETAISLKDHSLGNKCVKSDIYIKALYPLEEYRLSISLDYLQVLPVLCDVESAYVIDESLYIYRYRKDSISHNAKLANIKDNDWINVTLREYLAKRGFLTEQINNALELAYAEVFLSRLFALRWKISKIERDDIRKMEFLCSMTQKIDKLIERKEYQRLFWYVEKGIWGPRRIFYRIYLKTVVNRAAKR